MSLSETFSRNLHAARVRRHLTQQMLASKVGLTVSYISMLERARRSPPLETLEALADALAVDPRDLLAEPFRR